MNKATTLVLTLAMIAFSVNVSLAGNGGSGHGGNKGGGNRGGNHNNGGNHNSNHHNSGHHNNSNNHWQHNKYKNYGHHNYRYRYYTPYTYSYPVYQQPAPQQPIVINTPVNVVTPPTPARVEKVVVKPDTKVAMGDTVRITSEKIRDSRDGRATMKIGHSSRKLEVVDWADGYAVVRIPVLNITTEKVVTIMVFNGPGKLANRIDALLVQPSQEINQQAQYADDQN